MAAALRARSRSSTLRRTAGGRPVPADAPFGPRAPFELRALGRERAREAVATAYWKPLYKYCAGYGGELPREDARGPRAGILRRPRSRRHGSIASIRVKAKFRTFVRVCVDRFVMNMAQAASRQKRGGGAAARCRSTSTLPKRELRRIEPSSTTPTRRALPPASTCARSSTRAVEGVRHELDATNGERAVFRAVRALRSRAEDDGSPTPTSRGEFGIDGDAGDESPRARAAPFRERVARSAARADFGSEEEFRAEARDLLGTGGRHDAGCPIARGPLCAHWRRWPEFAGRALRRVSRSWAAAAWARVYLAIDDVLGREVAIKMLNAIAQRSELERPAARSEARVACPARTSRHRADPRRRHARRRALFYVMKRIEGQTLDAHLRRVRDLTERLRIFERLCDPVAFAHARGLVHRDLKPANVMVGSFGEVLVLDWGVAKILDDDRMRPRRVAAADVHPLAGTARIVGAADRTPIRNRARDARLHVARAGAGAGAWMRARTSTRSVRSCCTCSRRARRVRLTRRATPEAYPAPLRAIVAPGAGRAAADRYADAVGLPTRCDAIATVGRRGLSRDVVLERIGRVRFPLPRRGAARAGLFDHAGDVAVWVRQRTGP